MLKAITLRHPWAWAIAKAGKDVENRTWHPEEKGGKVGMFLALHGGALPRGSKGWSEVEDGRDWIRNRMCLMLPNDEGICLQGIFALAKLVAVNQNDISPWAVEGQWHWRLATYVLPEPIPHKGMQGFWEPEQKVVDHLRTVYQENSDKFIQPTWQRQELIKVSKITDLSEDTTITLKRITLGGSSDSLICEPRFASDYIGQAMDENPKLKQDDFKVMEVKMTVAEFNALPVKKAFAQ